ncbi:MAG: peptidoglycan-binding protein [Acetobacteraceae bacterium]|nr:peptidoglycan-binding protein [Acetobacteraceae bacterium]
MPVSMTRQLWLTTPMMRGDDVLAVQRRLAELGAALTQDGLLGAGTRDAVQRFQANAHLIDDGVVGPLTWEALFGQSDPARVVREAPKDLLAPETVHRLSEVHGHFKDGCTWRVTPNGVDITGSGIEAPSEADGRLVRDVLARFRDPLLAAIARNPVPIENALACICTESSGNPAPLRREPGCNLKDPTLTPSRCSQGLMQTLLSTARAALHNPALPLEELERPEVSIMAGTAYMAQQGVQTRHDPPLAAAAYNAGSLRYDSTPANRWRLIQYPIGTSRHVDRFVRFFNAAVSAVDEAGVPNNVPSLRRLLR